MCVSFFLWFPLLDLKEKLCLYKTKRQEQGFYFGSKAKEFKKFIIGKTSMTPSLTRTDEIAVTVED